LKPLSPVLTWDFISETRFVESLLNRVERSEVEVESLWREVRVEVRAEREERSE